MQRFSDLKKKKKQEWKKKNNHIVYLRPAYFRETNSPFLLRPAMDWRRPQTGKFVCRVASPRSRRSRGAEPKVDVERLECRSTPRRLPAAAAR